MKKSERASDQDRETLNECEIARNGDVGKKKEETEINEMFRT